MSLVLTYDEIRREIGRFLSWDRNPANWAADDITDAADIIRRGSRRFYFPEATVLLDEKLTSHRWSFLQKELSITLTASVYHDLPSDFARITERPSIDDSNYPLEIIDEATFRDLQNSGPGVGEGQYYTVKRNTGAATIEYKIGLYPTPSAGTLTGWYQYNPETIDASNAPIIPPLYSEAFLAAILATADELLNYETQSEGRQLERFGKLLASAIRHDQLISGSVRKVE